MTSWFLYQDRGVENAHIDVYARLPSRDGHSGQGSFWSKKDQGVQEGDNGSSFGLDILLVSFSMFY